MKRFVTEINKLRHFLMIVKRTNSFPIFTIGLKNQLAFMFCFLAVPKILSKHFIFKKCLVEPSTYKLPVINSDWNLDVSSFANARAGIYPTYSFV